MRLNLGCGEETIDRPGWVNVDMHPRKPHVLRADVLSLPFPEGSAEQIATSHLLEHLPDTAAALKEWKRVLAPGGELLVCVPDAAYEAEWLRYHLEEAHKRGEASEHRHHVDLTQASLEKALRDAGFVDVRAVDTLERWELPGKCWWQACASGRKEVPTCA